jgi:hypothetical protein
MAAVFVDRDPESPPPADPCGAAEPRVTATFAALLIATFVLAAATMTYRAPMLAQSGTPTPQTAGAQPSDQTGTAGTAQEEPRPPREPAKSRDQRVSGKVLDRDGKAIDRAEVSFAGPKKNKVFTDARGEFTFTGPPGDYAVTVKAGSRRQDFRVQIDDNQLKPSTLIIDPEGML